MELFVTSDKKGLDADKIVTGRTCIIGQSGSGKSYAVAVLCEELAKNNIGFCIVDTEGEYFSLKEKYTMVWAGLDSNADINISEADLDKLAHKCIKDSFPLILDVSEVDNPKEIVARFCASLYKYGTSFKKPYLLIIEEIDKFVPQTGERVKEIEEISRRGRKRGLGLLLATQRPAFVNKNILSQCAIQIIGRLTIPNDITAVRFFFRNKKDLEKLPSLQAGEFFLMGEAGNREIRTRMRETTHKATTPKLKERTETKFEIEKFKSSFENEEIAEEREISTNVVPVKINSATALEIAKKAGTKFLLVKPQITGIKLTLRPLHLFKIRESRKQLIGKKFVEFYAVADCISGKMLNLEKGYSATADPKDLIGLSQNEISVLSLMKKEISVSEICARTGYSESSAREIIAKLEERKLISNKKSGRVNLYFIFTKMRIPALGEFATEAPKIEKSKIKADIIEPKISKKEFENLFKALGGVVLEQEEIFYPFYTVRYLSGKKQETLQLDAVSGKQIRF